MRSGRWEPKEGLELEGKTLALIGSGAIAIAVARIAAAGFGMRVIGYARSARQTPSPHIAAITTDFAEAVGEADFVSLHIPGSPENARFINADRLALMPPRAWLINTARGAVVDELALYDALAGGRLAGAALDVFAREPYQPADPDHDLRTLANVIARAAHRQQYRGSQPSHGASRDQERAPGDRGRPVEHGSHQPRHPSAEGVSDALDSGLRPARQRLAEHAGRGAADRAAARRARASSNGRPIGRRSPGSSAALAVSVVVYGMPVSAAAATAVYGAAYGLLPDRLDHPQRRLPLQPDRRDRPVRDRQGVGRAAVGRPPHSGAAGRVLVRRVHRGRGGLRHAGRDHARRC